METVDIQGCPLPKAFSMEAFQSAVDYKPRPDDVFVVTYPKCGTTWTGQIVQLIMRQGEPPDPKEFLSSAPFLEMTGGKAAEVMKRPNPIKTHLPYHLVPKSDEAKYVYVTRNPKDCCVSYFHHQKNMPVGGFTGTFDEFYEYFVNGTIYYGDFFDHLLQWFAHRDDPNVLFVTYEELKEDKAAAVLKIASFIGDAKYAEPLRRDPEKLQNVLKFSNFSFMKESINKSMVGMFTMSKEDIEKSDLPSGMKELLSKKPAAAAAAGKAPGNKPAPTGDNFVRKGVIGDWKNHFTAEQSKRLDEKFAERLKGTKFHKIWEKYMEN